MMGFGLGFRSLVLCCVAFVLSCLMPTDVEAGFRHRRAKCNKSAAIKALPVKHEKLNTCAACPPVHSHPVRKTSASILQMMLPPYGDCCPNGQCTKRN